MTGVIIAGGRGERLRCVTKNIPKPMVKIAGHPLLLRQIEALKRNGIREIYILTGHLGHVIRRYFGDGRSLGVDIRYVQEDRPLGTSGCVKALEGVIKSDFLLVYGDLAFDMDIKGLAAFHKMMSGIGAIVVHPNDHPYDSDIIDMDTDGRITGFITKEKRPAYCANLVNAAIYMLSPDIFRYIRGGEPGDFVKDVFPAALNDRWRLYGYKTAEYIKDIGTVGRLEQAVRDFIRGKIQRLSKGSSKRPAIFFDRDGTLVDYVEQLHAPRDLALYRFSAPALKAVNDSDFLSFLITNQPVVARGLLDINGVKEMNNKLSTLLGEGGAYLDDIFFCPHHPDKGYTGENSAFKVICECRKPKTLMIRSAARKYNVDLKNSWIIGDSTVDVQTGVNAGLRTALVMTGLGGRDGKFGASPDFIFDNVRDAVDFILLGGSLRRALPAAALCGQAEAEGP